MSGTRRDAVTRAVRVRLAGALLALGSGAAALIVAILLVRGTLG